MDQFFSAMIRIKVYFLTLGDWADNDSHWRLVSEKTKKSMGLHNLYDGEFWMDFFRDFCREFEEVSICTLGPDFDSDANVDSAEPVKVIFGEWTLGRTAGGCRNDLRKFAKNPQFILTIHDDEKKKEEDDSTSSSTDSNDDDDQNHNNVRKPSKKCQVIICLAQEHRRSFRDKKVKLLQIGFCLYKANAYRERLNENHFMYQKDCGTSGPYINYREVFNRFELTPDQSYVIIPATFEPNCPGRFMIRVYAEKTFSLREYG